MQEPKPFSKGARVLFIGDSITCNGTFMAHIQEYYRSHFPEDKVKCFNAGVSGGTVGTSALRYLEKDLADFSPTHAVITLGVNDVGYGGENLYGDEHKTRERAKTNEIYFQGMERLADTLTDRGISLTFCTPTPVDGGRAPDAPGTKRVMAALSGYACFCRGLAMKYGAGVVDFHTAMMHFSLEMQKDDPKFTLYWDDRVHPTPELGHVVMALTFLRAQGFTDIPEPTPEAYRRGEFQLTLSEANEERRKIENMTRFVRCADYLIVGDLWQAPFEERMEPIRAFLKKVEAGEPHNAYIANLAREYGNFAPKEEELLARLRVLTDALYEKRHDGRHR